MITISHLDHLVLTVADVEKTCDFYHRVPGFSVITFRGDRKALVFGRQKINLHQAGNEFLPNADKPVPRLNRRWRIWQKKKLLWKKGRWNAQGQPAR